MSTTSNSSDGGATAIAPRPPMRSKSRTASAARAAKSSPAAASSGASPSERKPESKSASRGESRRGSKASSKSSSKPRTRRRRSDRKPRRGWRSAATSDRRELYELAVQSPHHEADFIERVFRKVRGRAPHLLREDFAASFCLASEWVRRGADRRAIAIDLDPEILAWGQRRRAKERSADELARIRLAQADVATFRGPSVDVVAAFNFSYFVFKTRAALRRYFENARRALVRDGVLVIDAYGGYESWSVMEEERNLDGFTYVWDQASVNPITNEVLNHIHFRFPDGSEIKRAFTYDWRLWTLPEVRETLIEAGFSRTTVYWEGTERRSGEGNGVFKPSERGEPCAGWIAYIVAER